jgi:hypothetical protein
MPVLEPLNDSPKAYILLGKEVLIVSRFIRILQRDIVTNPEKWKDSGPGKYIKLSNKAKNVYSVLSIIAFSSAGNAEGRFVKPGGKLGKGWFWASHSILQQLTGSNQKTVQRAIIELRDEGFIEYEAARKAGQQCFFRIKRVEYNVGPDNSPATRATPKTAAKMKKKPMEIPSGVDMDKPDLPCDDDYADKKPVAKTEVQPRGPVERVIPYKEGVLFQSGKDTHDARGELVDRDGNFTTDSPFTHAQQLFEYKGEEAFLKEVLDARIENHLVPEYREKLEKLKKKLEEA